MKTLPKYGFLTTACLALWLVRAIGQSSVQVQRDTLNNTTTLANPFSGGDNLLVETLVTNATGALSQSVAFTVAPGATSVSGSAAWEITTAAGSGPRLIGVNIDVFNSSNALVLSDTFQGTTGGFATSSFLPTSLAPGNYTLVATGTAVRDASLDISLSFAGAPSMAPAESSGSLVSSSTIGSPLFATDSVMLNTLATGQTGALSQSVAFTVGSGVTGFTGSAAWEVGTAAGTGPRLVGVNIDVLDSSNTSIFSDTFLSTNGGFAFSSLDGLIGPGNYTLVATGTAVRDANLNVSMTFDGSPVAPVPSSGTSVPVNLDTLNNTTTLAKPFSGGDNLAVDTLVTNATGALNQTVAFTVAPGVTSVSGAALWETTTAAGNGPRLLGVNIDVFNSSNALVLSDTFQGVTGGFASSSFLTTSLAPGNYRLVATGTGARDSSLDISLSFAGTPANAPAEKSGFLVSASTLTAPLLATDSLLLNALVTGQTGALSQSMAFTVGAGVTGFTGSAAWEIGTAAGTGPRLVDVNIDILDSTNTSIFSDTFLSTNGGFAFSSLDGLIGPGNYTLVATGTAVRDVNLNVSMTFGGTPGFPNGVPDGDASSVTLFVATLGLLGWAGRRRSA